MPLLLPINSKFNNNFDDISAMRSVMTTEENEVKRPLTLMEIAPNWARRFDHRNGLPFPLSLTWLKWYFELDHPSKCVVGEAHGYQSSYQKECNQCDRLGWEFGGSFILHSKSGLQRNIYDFVEHWNKEHYSEKNGDQVLIPTS